MTDPYDTEPLFDVPDKYKPPQRVRKYPLWEEYKGKRTSCDDCIRALAAGDAKFMAEPARHIRVDHDRREYLCARHTYDRQLAER